MVYSQSQANRLDPTKLANLDASINMIVSNNLAVIVDIHAFFLDTNTYVYSTLVESDPFYPDFKLFWQNFAAHLSSTFSADMVFFEPLNEPVFYDNPNAWLTYQQDLVTTIRANAPNNTILVTGARWSSNETLVQMTPLSDTNVVYNFHYYTPFTFTHQGAEWVGEPYQSFHGIPYPSSPEIMAPIIPQYSTQEQRDYLTWYGDERWSVTKLQQDLSAVINWATTNNVKLFVGEFGVHKPVAPHPDRVQWTYDMRTTLENNGIGWSMWSYEDNFGLIERQGGTNYVDYDLAYALGLNPTGTPMDTPTPMSTSTTCVITTTVPTLVSPTHRAHLTNRRPTFTWNSVANAQSYRLMVYLSDRSFEFKKRVFQPNYTLATGEALTTARYLWRVRTQDNTCSTWTGWSSRNTLFID
jgi:endoglucanase